MQLDWKQIYLPFRVAEKGGEMAESSPEQNEPKMFVDEDWKSRVEAERETLDAVAEEQAEQQKQQEAQPDESPVEQASTNDDTQPDMQSIPPADFATIVSIFSTQAMLALGLVPGPDGKPAEKQLPVAKHLIDILGVLEEKTKNNLTENEAAMMESSLHQLRMVYLDALKSSDNSSKD